MVGFSIKGSILEQRKGLYGSISIALSFMLFAFIVAKFFSPDFGSNAATQNASETVGPYTLSMSNDSVANVDITPTASQQIFTTTNNLTLSNSCSQGATISISTNSTTSNDLTRNGSDSATKIIPATTGSSLLDNTWGFSTDGGTTYNPVPVKGGTSTYVYDAVEAATNKNIPVQFGIKTDSNLPSGTYTTDVVYTAAVKSGCLTYSLAWDLNGGTGKSGTSYATTNVNWGTTFDLTNYTPTRDGYTFTGWSNGSSTFTGNETTADPNPSGVASITMTAQWEQLVYNFDYTGGQQTLTIPSAGYYKLEVWGAQGASSYKSGSLHHNGGYGGYSVGVANLTKNSVMYINVGGSSSCSTSPDTTGVSGGYNGGGSATARGANSSTGYIHCGGGGASHIATVSGELKNLSSYRNTDGTNISKEILIVAGGGGGAGSLTNYAYQGGRGGNGGGINGAKQISIDDSNNVMTTSHDGVSTGGTQTAGGSGRVGTASFGLGTGRMGSASCGGGGGWYGGGSDSYEWGGSGGSGYIGSSNLLSEAGITKHMTCYSCTTSTAAATRTISNTTTPNLTATPDVAKLGNGYARITYLGNIPTMQTFEKSMLTNVGDSMSLEDERDGNFYTVKKLADGNVWMTENLRIIDKEITSADSNLPENETWTIPASNISLFYNRTGLNSAYYIQSYGGYYSFYTATAGWGTGSVTSGNSPKDICPKGWRLPTGGPTGEFKTLYDHYNSVALISNEPQLSVYGYVTSPGSYVGNGTVGGFWSSTPSDSDYAYYMYLWPNGPTVNPANRNYKYTGYTIRCMAK